MVGGTCTYSAPFFPSSTFSFPGCGPGAERAGRWTVYRGQRHLRPEWSKTSARGPGQQQQATDLWAETPAYALSLILDMFTSFLERRETASPRSTGDQVCLRMTTGTAFLGNKIKLTSRCLTQPVEQIAKATSATDSPGCRTNCSLLLHLKWPVWVTACRMWKSA